MNRRTLLKLLPFAGLPAVLSLAKGKAKAKFPRYFTWLLPPQSHFPDERVYCATTPNIVWGITKAGTTRRLHRHRPLKQHGAKGYLVQAYDDGPTTISDVEQCVARGFLREITAAEAKALLRQDGLGYKRSMRCSLGPEEYVIKGDWTQIQIKTRCEEAH